MKWPKWFPLHDPAFRWGLLNPFGPPPPWWPQERREAYFAEHGTPWERQCACGGAVEHGGEGG